MSKAYRMRGRDEKLRVTLWSENLEGRDCLEDIGVDWRIILKWIFEKEFEVF
jgi:hypothetical protein